MKQSGFGIASLILGIISIVTVFFVVGIIPAILGVIFAIIALCQKNKKHGTAIGGLVCSLMGIIIFTLLVVAINSNGNDGKNESPANVSSVTESAETNELTLNENAIETEIDTKVEIESPEEPESVSESETESESESVNESEMRLDSESEIEQSNQFEYDGMTVKYLKHEVSTNSVDEKVLIVYYEFTNNSDENKSFDYAFSDKCFQNGVEVEHSYWHANEESKNSEKEIKPGTTLVVASSFVLGDCMDDVELEIEPWITFSENILLSMDLKLE